MRDFIRLRAPVPWDGVKSPDSSQGGPGSPDHGCSASTMSFVTQTVTRFIVTQIVTRLIDSDSQSDRFLSTQLSVQFTSYQLSVIQFTSYQFSYQLSV